MRAHITHTHTRKWTFVLTRGANKCRPSSRTQRKHVELFTFNNTISGNVSFDVPMLFGFVNTLPTDVKPVADSNGMFGETIYYDNGDVTGYVTVATPSCAFVNEMSYARLPDGGKYKLFVKTICSR